MINHFLLFAECRAFVVGVANIYFAFAPNSGSNSLFVFGRKVCPD